MAISRRHLFAGTGAVGLTAAAGVATSATASAAQASKGGYGRGAEHPGPVIPDPKGLLSLPAGFAYKVVSVSGETLLETGEKTPDRPDGTGAFAVGRRVRLVQNHELGPGEGNLVPTVEGTVYDAGIGAAGGCTVIEVTREGDRVKEWVGLSGTISNCAGGVTPWGTWLSCEETETRKGTTTGGVTTEQDHGWIFEVAPDRPEHQHPKPIKAWGRFAHEAVVVAGDRRTVYLTEDASNPNGLFYRWTAPGHIRLGRGVLADLPDDAGRLEALQVSLEDGTVVDDLSRFTSADIGRELTVRWVEVPDRFATTTSTRKQTYAQKITRSKKLEGAWAGGDGLYFAASFSFAADTPPGGVPHDGQIWYLDAKRQVLVLQAYFPYIAALHDGSWSLEYQKSLPTDYFDGPDNVHVSPYGGLVIAEDGVGVNGLVGWTRDGGAFRLARNEIPFEGENSEMTGPTFSPDGRVLFANVQEPGHTFAITGDFRRILRG